MEEVATMAWELGFDRGQRGLSPTADWTWPLMHLSAYGYGYAAGLRAYDEARGLEPLNR